MFYVSNVRARVLYTLMYTATLITYFRVFCVYICTHTHTYIHIVHIYMHVYIHMCKCTGEWQYDLLFLRIFVNFLSC